MKTTSQTNPVLETVKPAGAFRVKYWGTATVLFLILGPLSYPSLPSGPLRLSWLVLFCAAALTLILPDCRTMWLLRPSKTPRWITLLVGIAAIALSIVAAIALLELNKRGVIRLGHFYFWIPALLAISLASLCAWICEARHFVRIYWSLDGYRYISKSVQLNHRDWLRFGGWFSLEPKGEKEKFILRRAKVDLLRVGADLFKVFLILLAVYFASMPFWPLAVPPVPAELKAKYPIPEFQPRGNGEAEKIWFSLYPAPLDMTTNEPPELLAAPLYRLCVELGSGEEVDWTSPEAAELRGWLAKVEPEIHRMAELCLAEDPPKTPATDYPNSSVMNYRPMIELLRILPGIHAQDGDADAALKALRSAFRIASYYTRGEDLVGWLVGNLLPDLTTRSVVSLYSRNMITPAVAQEFEIICKEWQEHRGKVVRSIVKERINNERWMDVFWKKGCPPKESRPEWVPRNYERDAWLVRRWGWVIGNDYRSARAASKNVDDRMEIEAVIWSDPSVAHPGEITKGLWEYLSKLSFRRGILSAAMMPLMRDYYRRYFATDAAQRIGHALAAIGAYQNVNRVLPTLLEDAYATAGLNPDLQTPYVDQVPEYRRLDAGAPDETNTYAFTLTIWGDGGRCDKGGGVSWLIVRNPAFGEELLRCWNWNVLTAGDRSVESQEVRLLEKPNELDPALIPAGGAALPVLGVPATLLSADLDTIKDAEKALRRFGWSEVPIPPRRSRWTE